MARRCRPFKPSALRKGTRIERREHHLSMKLSRKIARDHLCKKPTYYSKEK